MCITPGGVAGNSIQFDIFGKMKMNRKPDKEAFKKLLNKSENLIEERIKNQSPFCQGKRNPKFIHPSFETHFEIGEKNPKFDVFDRKKISEKLQNLNEDELHYLETVNKTAMDEELPDPMAFHLNLNNRRKEAISAKIKSREQLSEKVSKLLIKPNKNEKQKLIEFNEKTECFINKPNVNPLLERAKERCRLNDIFVMKNQKLVNRINDEKDKYFKNYIFNYQPPEHKGFVNNRLEPKVNYRKAVEEQMYLKKQQYQNEKKVENILVTEVNEAVSKQMEDDERLRQNRIYRIKKEFEEGNRILIQKKAERREMERVKQREEENEKICKVKEEVKQVMDLERDRREREKRELSSAIQRHMEAKRLKELKEIHLLQLRANKSANTREGLNLDMM